jgi:hypothetical protein
MAVEPWQIYFEACRIFGAVEGPVPHSWLPAVDHLSVDDSKGNVAKFSVLLPVARTPFVIRTVHSVLFSDPRYGRDLLSLRSLILASLASRNSSTSSISRSELEKSHKPLLNQT